MFKKTAYGAPAGAIFCEAKNDRTLNKTLFPSLLPLSCSKKEKTQKIAKVTNYEGNKDSGTCLKKTPKKRVKRSTKDAISSKTKK